MLNDKYSVCMIIFNIHRRHADIQGRGDGPKAGTCGASEAARSKSGARTAAGSVTG